MVSVMRRVARRALRTAALGGWAALVLAAVTAAPGSAWAADAHGHGHAYGATDGPGGPHMRSDAVDTGSRGDEPGGDGDRRGDGTGVSVAAPVVEPPAAPQEPAGDVGTALGPVSGSGPAAITRAPESRTSTGTGIRRVPVLSFDAPSGFGPTSLAGRLHDAPGAVVVQVAIRRGSAARGCGWWSARSGRFGGTRRGTCTTARWITARVRPAAGGLRWRAALGRPLPAGTHRYVVRVLDGAGHPIAFVRI